MMELRDVLQLLAVGIAFLAVLGGLVGFILRQLDTRFETQANARAEGAKALKATIDGYAEQSRSTAEQVGKLERDFLEWKAEMPLQYVRREDYVRGQTIIEAKLDAVYNKLEVVRMKGSGNG